MSSDNEIRHGRHCVFLMHVHLVFVTRYRRGVFTREILDDLRGIFESVCSDFEAKLAEFDGEEDHVHLLVNYPPKVAVSALVNSLKGVSSRMIRKKNYPTIRKKLWGGAPPSPSSASTSNSSKRRIDHQRRLTAASSRQQPSRYPSSP